MFSKYGEKEVSLAIIDAFFEKLKSVVVSDVVIVGAGPAGLVAAYYLSLKGKKVVLIEKNNAPGGGAWSGGYLMNELTIRYPGNEVLEDMGLKVKEVKKGLFTADALYICAGLIKKALEAGAVILNLTLCEDIIMRNGVIEGVVINWSPIQFMPRPMRTLDPIVLESKVVIDATGHDAAVAAMLAKRGLLEIAGEGAMHIEASEDLLAEKTGRIFPGLYTAGMSVCSVYGLPRMGPTFGGMYVSGKIAAEKILAELG